MPYVIYGPPGTGKTVIALRGDPPDAPGEPEPAPGGSAVELGSGPSGAAHHGKRRLDAGALRVIVQPRQEQRAGDVLPYARYDNDTDGFVVPPAHELRSFRIVVVTLSTAGKLPNLGVCNHFTVSSSFAV